MGNDLATAAQAMFGRDVASARFQAGAMAGRWRLRKLDWPTAVIDVAARPLPNEPPWYRFKFDVAGYPSTAPTAVLWSSDVDAPLPHDEWPKGPDADRVFNPNWNASAVYLPLDRVAQAGHDGWMAQNRRLWWTPAHQISDYLGELWRVLNSSGYTGVTNAA